jgi:predicted CopG family antitoxin
MATKTISLKESAYERLKALKEENESFSDVVERITSGTDISEFYGVLSEETAEELEENIKEKRERSRESREERIEEVKRQLDT